MNTIKNIIFDLGGVLYDIRYENIADAFRELGVENFEKHYSKEKQMELIDRLETGQISVSAFYNEIRSALDTSLTNEQIEDAWNAILIDFPAKSLELLGHIKLHYQVYLFSNTNAINHHFFTQHLTEKYGFNLFEVVFNKAYFSHLIGLKKPEKEAFAYLLRDAQIDASETLFIDDSPQHLEGAKLCGINTFHLVQREDLYSLFSEEGILTIH